MQTTTQNLVLSPAEEQMIRDAAAKLDHFAPRILSCRVVIEMPKGRGRSGRQYRVHIKLDLPGGDCGAPQVRRGICFGRAEGVQGRRPKLQDHARRQRGDVKAPLRLPRGVVTRLFPWEGYGFLTSKDGREIYFHRHSVLNDAFDELEEGVKVRYVEEAGDQGAQASTVAVASK